MIWSKNTGNRAALHRDTAGLSEIMASFIRHLPATERSTAIDNADNIDLFLALAGTRAARIYNIYTDRAGISVVTAVLGRIDLFPLAISDLELRNIYLKATNNWSSQDRWVALKMAVYTRTIAREPSTKVQRVLESA